MKKIFRVDPDNLHYPVLWSNPSDFFKFPDLNFKSLGSAWPEQHFEFYKKGKPVGRTPEIAPVTPCLAFRRDLQGLLFEEHNPGVELLPIRVDGEEWFLINCLNSIREYDESRSVMHRDSTGTIFMVQKLVVSDCQVGTGELFTIADSNRSTVFVNETFANRVKHAKLKGVKFKQIGEICC